MKKYHLLIQIQITVLILLVSFSCAKKNVFVLKGHDKNSAVNFIHVSNNSNVIASASNDKTVKLWRIDELKPFKTFHGHTGKVKYCFVSIKQDLVVSYGLDKKIIIWRLSKNRIFKVLNLSNSVVLEILLSNNGRKLYVLKHKDDFKKKNLLIYDIKNNENSFTIQNVNHIAGLSNDDVFLYFVNSDNGLLRYNVKLKKKKLIYKNKIHNLIPVTIDRFGRYLALKAVSNSLTQIRVVNLETKSTVNVFNLKTDNVIYNNLIRFSPHSKYIAIANGNEILLYNIKTGKLVNTYGGGSFDKSLCMRFSPDGKYIAYSSNWGKIYIFKR